MKTEDMMKIDEAELAERLEFAVDVAEEAGKFILDYYQNTDLDIELKGDLSPVTEADRGAELLIREHIENKYPEDGVLGEEFPELESKNGIKWILDPIDGTKSFVHGVPLFGTLIGMECDGELLIGVSRFPALDEVMYAAKGQGAWWKIDGNEPRKAQVKQNDQLSQSVFCTTNYARWDKIGRKDALDKLCSGTLLTRGWGDCYGHMLVATGRADVMIDPELNAWDAAALVPILQEAGGHFIDWNGKASIYSGQGLSVSDAMKDTILEILAE